MQTDQQDQVIATIEQFVRDELLIRRPGLELDADTDLVDRGILDSVGLFRMLGFIEDTFGISILPNEIMPENFGTIGAISSYIIGRRGQQ